MSKKNNAETEQDDIPLGEPVNEDIAIDKPPVIASLSREFVIADETDLARELYDKSRYGEPVSNKKFQYSLIEAFYLLEWGKLKVLDSKDKELKNDDFVKKARKVEPNFLVRYAIFKDLRKRGYFVKTALKFGVDF